MPMLICVEISNQQILLEIIQKLHEDLKNGCMDTVLEKKS